MLLFAMELFGSRDGLARRKKIRSRSQNWHQESRRPAAEGEYALLDRILGKVFLQSVFSPTS
jgi:hypothetical protein